MFQFFIVLNELNLTLDHTYDAFLLSVCVLFC